MTLTTLLRNVEVGLVIATGNLPGTAAMTATLAYGLLEIAGSLLLTIVGPAIRIAEGCLTRVTCIEFGDFINDGESA
jgi:hypothetical protein